MKILSQARHSKGQKGDNRWKMRGNFPNGVLNNNFLKSTELCLLVDYWKDLIKEKRVDIPVGVGKKKISVLPHFLLFSVLFQEPFQVKVASEALLIMDLVRIICCVYRVILTSVLVHFCYRHKTEYGRHILDLNYPLLQGIKNKSFFCLFVCMFPFGEKPNNCIFPYFRENKLM